MSEQPSLRILVLHGPNLNLLGEREPDVYGTDTLDQVNDRIRMHASGQGVQVGFAQSNIEGDLIEAIHDARTWADGILINAGGYSHTSVAIRDALASVPVPAAAVHLSNLAAREGFRQRDVVAGACIGVVAGFGWRSYVFALDAIVAHIRGER